MEDSKRLYIISEFLQGNELQKKVISEGTLSEKQAVIVIKKVIEALQAYVQNGLIY